MPFLVAFTSLPFGLKEGIYTIKTPVRPITVHVSPQRYNPLLFVGTRPELAQTLPPQGIGEGFTTYTWYDHPFVLRAIFGHNVAALGSINSGATALLPISAALLNDPTALNATRDRFGEEALLAFNHLVGAVRRQAHLYHLLDLRRDDIDLSVRAEDGTVLIEDPLQETLIEQEVAHSETFDLVDKDETWYQELAQILAKEHPIDLADELLIEAERALLQRFPRQAITTCHTAIEAAASTLLTQNMQRRGLSDEEIDQILSTRNLVSKLGSIMGRFCGYDLRRENRSLWQAFGALNNLRNDIVHRGRRPTYADAENALRITRQLLDWIAMVRQRNSRI